VRACDAMEIEETLWSSFEQGGPPSAIDVRRDLSRDLNPHGPLFSASLSERSRRGSSHVRKVFECVHVCGQATVRIKKEGANRIKSECV